MPMVPPAPGRFSTTAGCPRLADNLSETLRAMTSVTLPGVNATMFRSARLGSGASCATACGASAISAAATVSTPPLAMSLLFGRLGFRPGVGAGRVGEHELDDLEFRDVHRRVHVQEHRRVAEQLLDSEVEHDAVAAVQLDRVLRHLEYFLGSEQLHHVAQLLGVGRALVHRARGFVKEGAHCA